jgi:hypothetical protein
MRETKITEISPIHFSAADAIPIDGGICQEPGRGRRRDPNNKCSNRTQAVGRSRSVKREPSENTAEQAGVECNQISHRCVEEVDSARVRPMFRSTKDNQIQNITNRTEKDNRYRCIAIHLERVSIERENKLTGIH